jgi:NAD(P)-dependent dehydrogenase (short-subunit alcohol dehydrogenase family)
MGGSGPLPTPGIGLTTPTRLLDWSSIVLGGQHDMGAHVAVCAESFDQPSKWARELLDHEEVASAYIHLMANTFITGQILAVDGGVMLDK